MDNNDYVYKETPEERAAMPEITLSKWDKTKEWCENHKFVIAIAIIVLFTAYTFFMGGGKYIGTWQAQDGRYTYEFEFKPFGFGKMNAYRNDELKESTSIHWEYDDSTSSILIEVDGKEGKRFLAYKVLGNKDNTLTISQDGSSKKSEVFTKK